MPDSPGDPPPAPFVVGVARSGTTLLRLMLDAHPDLAIPHETHFLTAVADLKGGGIREELFRRITGFETWPDLAVDARDFFAALERIEPFDVASGIRAFYRLYAARFGKPRWGDKTPPYLGHIETISRLLPEARFVHIVRDGRDVALSLRPLWFAPSTTWQGLAGNWASSIREARRQAGRSPRYTEVRYEDLVREPERVLAAVCRFLDLPFRPAEMLRYHERANARLSEARERRNEAGRLVISREDRLRQQRHTSLPPDPGRIGRWRTEMSREGLSEFESVAGELLGEIGYEVGTGTSCRTLRA